MRKLLALVIIVVFILAASPCWGGIPHLINYQGMLTNDEGVPLSGDFDLTFRVFDDSTAGTQKWAETQYGIIVTDGLFSVSLGDSTAIDLPFNEDYWLDVEIGVLGSLSPRVRLTSVGYAYRAERADTSDYSLQAQRADTADYAISTDTAAYALAGGEGDVDWSFRITDTADTTIITGGEWGLARYGNLLYGNEDSTHVNLGVACSTGVAGQNRKYCAIGGGVRNTASGNHATVGGGERNIAIGNQSTVGGGSWNTASGLQSTVSGGYAGNASGESATIGGGWHNLASGAVATVAGGQQDTASGDFAAVAGGVYNVASGNRAAVVGGTRNIASGAWAFVGAGILNTASGQEATVGGGDNNTASGTEATVGGGKGNIASNQYATVGGGEENTASGLSATIAGGNNNTANSTNATVGGGGQNTASGNDATVGGGFDNNASEQGATIAGGVENTASYFVATVGGGIGNTASGSYATVGGGDRNTASNSYATVGGGYYNTISGNYATVAGGDTNTVSGSRATVGGGSRNRVEGNYSTVGGGYENAVTAMYSTVAGGHRNKVETIHSFAAGSQVNIASGADYTFAFGRNCTTSTANAVIFWHPDSATRMGVNVTNPNYAITLPNIANNSGQGYGYAWIEASSIRWKENISQIENPLDKVMALRGIYFDWKQDKTHDIGMIAEEVVEVIPEVVTYDKNGVDAQGLNYARLTALLVEAMKEQQKEIEKLQEEINALKKVDR